MELLIALVALGLWAGVLWSVFSGDVAEDEDQLSNPDGGFR